MTHSDILLPGPTPLTPAAFYAWDPRSGRLAWAGNVEPLLGCAASAAPADLDGWLALVHPEDRAAARQAFDPALEGRDPAPVECRIRRPNGHCLAVRAAGALVSPACLAGQLTPASRAGGSDGLALVAEATLLAVLLVDGDGAIRYASRPALELFGYTAEELTGQPVEVLVPEDRREGHLDLRRRYQEAPSGRPMLGRELQARRKDGRLIPVALGLQPTLLGTDPAVAAFVLDLTEFKRAEQDLARFFDLSLDLLCIAGTDSYFRRVNPRFTQVLGHSPEELVSRPFLDFVHPEDRPATVAEVERLARGEPTVRFENRYRTRDGAYRWLEWNAAPVQAEGQIFAVARDVTEGREMRDRLEANARRERAILDNTSAVIYVKDAAGRYEFVNRAFTRLFGVDPVGVVGQTDRDIFPAEAAAGFEANDARVVAGGVPLEVEEQVPHADGPHRYISVKVPLPDAAGRVRAVAGISTDITDRLRADEAERELRTGRLVQQRLYPQAPPNFPGVDVAGASLSMSHLSGDYFDFIPCADGRLVLAVGDVSGHGLGPALTMVEARALLRLMLGQTVDLAAVAARVNHHLTADTPDTAFVTLFLAGLHPDGRRLEYVGAGHEAWLLRDDRWLNLESTGMALGVLDPTAYEVRTAGSLGPGDVLLVCSDGVEEALGPDGEMFGGPRMQELVARHAAAPARQILDALLKAVHDFAGDQPQADDVTALVARGRDS